MNSFELPLLVRPQDIDALCHVNNVVYLRWMQEAAAAHWEAAAAPELREQTVWVVVRHEIDYKAPAFDGEHLVARTWVGKPAGATWERFVEIRRPEGDKLLARGRSVYAALDKAGGKPRRVDAQLREPFGA